MNTRALRILGVITVAALLLAWWLNRSAADPAGSAGAGTAFLTGYRDQINAVSRVELDDGENPLKLEKRGAQWVDTGRGGYPVKSEEVKKLLLALNQLERREAKTDKPALHGELQLAAEGEAETRGKILRLWTAGAEAPAWELVIGKAKWEPVRGLYLRMLSENQCWFAAGELQLPFSPTAWFDKEIVNVNQLDVAKVVLVRGGETFTIARPDGDTPWTLAELPEGRTLQENSPFGSLANTLGYLNFDDVAPAADGRFNRDPDVVAEFTCFNGAVIRGTGWHEGDEVWMRFEATPPTAEAPAPPADPAADPAADPEAEAPPSQGGPTAETISTWNAGFSGWCFELSAWKGQALKQPLEDWLTPLAAPEPADEAAPPGEGGAAPADQAAPVDDSDNHDGHDHSDDQG